MGYDQLLVLDYISVFFCFVFFLLLLLLFFFNKRVCTQVLSCV